jgi:hypothetical protein
MPFDTFDRVDRYTRIAEHSGPCSPEPNRRSLLRGAVPLPARWPCDERGQSRCDTRSAFWPWPRAYLQWANGGHDLDGDGGRQNG